MRAVQSSSMVNIQIVQMHIANPLGEENIIVTRVKLLCVWVQDTSS